jgi:hypothetical protein
MTTHGMPQCRLQFAANNIAHTMQLLLHSQIIHKTANSTCDLQSLFRAPYHVVYSIQYGMVKNIQICSLVENRKCHLQFCTVSQILWPCFITKTTLTQEDNLVHYIQVSNCLYLSCEPKNL